MQPILFDLINNDGYFLLMKLLRQKRVCLNTADHFLDTADDRRSSNPNPNPNPLTLT